LLAGVDVVRLNLSHGTLQSHIERLHAVRAAAERTGQVVAVLADLPGPKVRSGQFADGGGVLVGGARLVLTPGEGPSTIERITVDYPTLLVDLQPGDRVVLGDGAISLRAEAVDEREVHCVVLTGGMVQGRPGVHLPSERLRLTTPTADDLVLGKAMAEAGVRLPGGVVRAGSPRSARRARSHPALHHAPGRQDRDDAGGGRAGSHRRRSRRGDGGSR
jgi:pyruvate kinase